MDLLIPLIILIILVALFGSGKGKSRRKHRSSSNRIATTSTSAKRKTSRDPKPDPYNFLYEYWKQVEKGDIPVPSWYHDPVTDAQLKRLKDDGTTMPGRSITKGQASSLIGLSEPPEPKELEILRFFKISGLPLKHQSIALIEIERLLKDPEKADQWATRPATQIQKEFFRYFGLSVPKGITAPEADSAIASHEMTEEEEEEWYAYSEILEELQDKDFRECYDLKKPSIAIIRQAIAQHTSDGQKITDISPDDLVDTILAIKPDLEKA